MAFKNREKGKGTRQCAYFFLKGEGIGSQHSLLKTAFQTFKMWAGLFTTPSLECLMLTIKLHCVVCFYHITVAYALYRAYTLVSHSGSSR